MLETTNLESFLDDYIMHTKLLTPLYIANRFCKDILEIPAKELMRRRISPELKSKRKDLSNEFLEIIKDRKYPKDNKFYIAD